MAAYKDSSGKITIDSADVQNDIRRINGAISDLQKSENAIKRVIEHANEGKGKTNDAIIAKAGELKKRISDEINSLESTKEFMNRTVEKYERIDREIKERIEREKSSEKLSSIFKSLRI